MDNEHQSKKRVSNIVFAAVSCAAALIAPATIFAAMEALPLLLALTGWVTAFLAYGGSVGRRRAFACTAVALNCVSGAFFTRMFFGLSRDPGAKLSTALIPLILDLILPAAIFLGIFFSELHRDKKSKQTAEKVFAAALLIAVAAFTVYVFVLNHLYGYLEFKPNTKWVCEDYEIVIEVGEDTSMEGYIVKDGVRTEIGLGTLYGRGDLYYLDKEGFMNTILRGDMSMSRDGKTLKLLHVEYFDPKFDLGKKTLVFKAE